SFCTDDSTIEKTVSYTSTPVLSFVSGPPEACCFCLSLRVRSGLMALQLMPPLVVLKIISPAKYSVLGSWGENTMGSVHWKRCFTSAAAQPIGFTGQGFTAKVWPVWWLYRVMSPP